MPLFSNIHLLSSSSAWIVDPTWTFFIVLAVILFAPMVLERLRIPSIAGMIFAGMLLGAGGFNILEYDDSFRLFGKVGLYYIMFMAALEMNLHDVARNRRQAIGFGLLTFAIPILLGLVANRWLLGYGFATALLMGAMYASHTLLTYPIVKRYGLGRLRAVNLAVGSTIVADTLTLLVLAIVGGMFKGEVSTHFWILLAVKLVVIVTVIIVCFPAVCRWFFKRYDDGVVQYVFVLALVFLGAGLMEFVGMEGILGAFLVGIVLNRVIPSSSPLMSHIEFIGNALFIPYFLIGVGMIINLRTFFSGYEAIKVGIVMTIIATLGKGFAALVAKRSYRLSWNECSLVFGLTGARAAATLAIVLVGAKMILPNGTPLFDEAIVAGTMLMILVSCIFSSFITDRAARNMVLHSEAINTQNAEVDRILIACDDEEKVVELTHMALALRPLHSDDQLNAVNVVTEDNEESLRRGQKVVERAAEIAAAANVRIHTQCRWSVNPVTGITHSIRECGATDVLVPFHSRHTSNGSQLGRFASDMLKAASQQVIIYRSVLPIGLVRRLHVVVPPHAEFEPGFHGWADRIAALVNQVSCRVTVYGASDTMQILEQYWSGQQMGVHADMKEYSDYAHLETIAESMRPDHMVVFISARMGMPSRQTYHSTLSAQVERHFSSRNVVIIYPAAHRKVWRSVLAV